MKYLGINLTREALNPNSENFQALLTEIEEAPGTRGGAPSSWLEDVNSPQMDQ